jgi:CheY-like chemotaxis protein
MVSEGRVMLKTPTQFEDGQGTVLVVEDSPTQARYLRTLLEREGLTVLLAYDGQSGLEIAQRLRPAAIILDLQMPRLNGFQVCRRLRSRRQTSSIPIIMLSSHSDEDMVKFSKQFESVDYVCKDAYADAVLLETLRQMGLIGQVTEVG